MTGEIVARARWGIVAPTFDPYGSGKPPPVVPCARRVEELGFDAVWVGDHLVCPAPVLDALCALSGVAVATSRVSLGISVLQLGLRHLVWTAKQLATIDALAPGRLRLGVGVGGEFEEEFEAAGARLQSRGARLDEMLDLLPALLRAERVDHDGVHVSVHSPALLPAPASLPPLSVGGRSDKALQRAARRADQWIGIWHSASTLAARRERLAELAESYGRRAPSVAMVILVNVNDDPEVARQETAAALNGQYRMPLQAVERWSALGPAGQVAEILGAYTDAGVSDLVLLPTSPEPLAQYERLAAVRDLLGLA